MTLDLPDHAIAFLSGFFGPGNDLKWNSIASGAIGNKALQFLYPWFSNVAKRDFPVILPRRRGISTTWYAMAFSPFQFRMLREDLAGFVGPTYTTFNGRKAELDAGDPVEASILGYFSQDAMTFQVAQGSCTEQSNESKVRDSLTLMRSTWEARPARGKERVRPTGVILRDFEMALVIGNVDGARQCLAELRTQGRLSAPNMLFLKVRYLAALSRWRDLLDLEDMGILLAIRRPLQVTQELLRAVYTEHLLVFEEAGDPAGAAAYFKAEVLHRYQPLFRVQSAMWAPEVVKSFMLLTASEPPGHARTETRDALLAGYPADAPDRAYIEQLAALIPASQPAVGKPFELAIQSYQVGDYDAAYRHVQACKPDRQALQLLLVCTKELGTLEAVRTTIGFMNKALAKEQEAALESKVCREIWSWLKNAARSAQDISTDWVSWLERLDNEGPWPSVMQDAERGCLEWKIEALRDDPERLRLLSELLHKGREETAQEELRNVLPFLIRFFLPEGRPDRTFRRLYQDLLFLLALDNRIGRDDLAAAYDIIAALLSVGLDGAEYSELAELADDLWTASDSPQHLDWALDVLDQFTAYPCLIPAARDRFAAHVLASLAKHSRRTQPEQWDMAEALFQDLGQTESIAKLRPSAVVPPAEGQAMPKLPGQLVALYTLDEAVGKRFRQVISKQFPGAQLALCHDKVASDRLQQLAREADVFIVNWRSAKHAATEAVTFARGGKPGLIYPQGKGCGSILRAFYLYLGEQAGEK